MIEPRKTEIIDEEIEDEIFEQFKLALLNEDSTRLLGKLYKYCYKYVEFEYDESAFNMDEAEDILRKLGIIRGKFLKLLEEQLSYKFENIKTDTDSYTLSFQTFIQENLYNITITLYSDSFDLKVDSYEYN